MEITKNTGKLLWIEEKAWLQRVILGASIGAGILLILATMREHGVQSWYRTTYWFGGLLSVSSAILLFFFVKGSRAVFDRESGRFALLQMRGMRTQTLAEARLDQIQQIRMEKADRGSGDRYRLTLQLDDNQWRPIHTKLVADPKKVEHIGQILQAFLKG